MRVALLLLPLLAAVPLAAQDPAPRSLTLEQAIQLGRSQGVNAALARINERIADARTGQRRADLLPSLTAGGSWTRQTLNLDEFGIPIATGVTDPFSLWRFQVSARQTLFDASTIARLRAAKDSALSVGADARAVGELAAAGAGIAYLRAVSAEETVRAREADSAVAAALLSDARQLVSAGASPAIDQTRSETQLASVLTQLEIARNQRDRTRLDLARALDLPSGTPLLLADSLSEVATADSLTADAAVAFALEHRAEVQAERGRTEVVRRSLKAMSLEYVPTLAAGGTYTQSGRELNSLAGTYALQVGLSWNILDGFRRPARQQEQSARLEAQQLRQHDAEQQVATEARQALLDQASADHQVRLAAERLRLAELELQQARERFSAGVAGSVETTNAQGGLVAARDGLIQARVNAAVAGVQVRRALGVLGQ
ncbi:MAG TPA: TolC family protein [Gemmatimonadales bacterium]|nr:TolC family protein [Gemmatimonadales bacterium]